MGKRNKPQPTVIPMPSGERYRLALLKVMGTHDDRPKELLFVGNDETADLQGGAWFVTAYVSELVFGKGR